jgi:hypothetical protein
MTDHAFSGTVDELMAAAGRAPARRHQPKGRRDDARVQAFFDELARALIAGEGATIAAMWDVPALVVDDEAVLGIDSLAEVQAFFGSARDQYNARGIIDTRAEVVRLDWVTNRIVMAEVRWPYLDKGGHEVGEELSTYTVRENDEGELKLRVAVMHGARTAE